MFTLGSTSEAIKYGFAVGRVRMLETRLLQSSAYERLLDAPTFREQQRILSETHFGRYLENAKTATDVERAVNASLEDLYEEFLQRASLPDAVVAFFRAPYDYGNLKAILKSVLLGVELDAPLSPLGTIPVDQYLVPEYLRDPLGAIAGSLLQAEEPPTAEEVDGAVDRGMFGELSELAGKTRIGFLSVLTTGMIDVANVKVLVRASVARRTPSDAEAMLIPGGTFDAREMAAHVRMPAAELASMLIERRVVEASAPEELTDLQRLDVTLDVAVARLMREARRVASGPEPVIAYVLARQAEAVSVRALLVGKLSRLEREVVRSRLRGAMT